MWVLAFYLTISIVFLILATIIAWKKRKRLGLHIPCLIMSIFWIPGIAIWFSYSRTNQGWEWIIISIVWSAICLVIGLCIMYGSKTIHFLGRDIIYLTILAIAILLGTLLVSAL